MSEVTIYRGLQGKLVLVTGASSGIGRATCVHFAACGANLVVVSRRNDRLQELKKELESKYLVGVHVASFDLNDPAACLKFYDDLPTDKLDFDIIVNNAGLALNRDLTWETDWKDMNTVINTNVQAVVRMLTLFVPRMLARNSGHIINVGSIAGTEAYQRGSIYCGTKHMLEAITSSLRMELVATPIRVSLISPGLVHTDFSLVRFGYDIEKAEAVYCGLLPLSSEDIADNIVYVASRPDHVQVANMTTFCTNQATVSLIHKRKCNENMDSNKASIDP